RPMPRLPLCSRSISASPLCLLCRRRSPFSSHPPPRHLHSFPTRRSSDLGGLVDEVLFHQRAGNGQLPVIFISLFAGNSLQNALEDRKSTRLNSSHVSISYAVFCLKKNTDRLSGQARLSRYSHTALSESDG